MATNEWLRTSASRQNESTIPAGDVSRRIPRTPASADAIGHGRIIAESPVALERLRAERLTSVESG
jgi:hypothetical protein